MYSRETRFDSLLSHTEDYDNGISKKILVVQNFNTDFNNIGNIFVIWSFRLERIFEIFDQITKMFPVLFKSVIIVFTVA